MALVLGAIKNMKKKKLKKKIQAHMHTSYKIRT